MKKICKCCGSKVKIKFTPIPHYGCLMTMEEFLEHLDNGWFINYDGTGYYAFKDRESDYMFDIRKYNMFGEYDKRFTHVMWYNR